MIHEGEKVPGILFEAGKVATWKGPANKKKNAVTACLFSHAIQSVKTFFPKTTVYLQCKLISVMLTACFGG